MIYDIIMLKYVFLLGVDIMKQSKAFIGYHGTDAESAASILEGKKFLPSGSWRDWLGKGIYFFEFDTHQAFMITKARKRIPEEKVVVLQSEILSENFLDLLVDEDRDFVEKFSRKLRDILKEKEKEIGIWKHKEGYVLDALYELYHFDLVRAAYFVPKKHTYSLLDYVTVQVQLCVKNSECIRSESIREVEVNA